MHWTTKRKWQRAPGALVFLFCVLGLLGRWGWLVDLRLDSQKGPLDIFMVFLALFKEGGWREWPAPPLQSETLPLISRPDGGELWQPQGLNWEFQLCRALVFSNESALLMRWPKYWSFSFSIIPSKEISGLISFRMDWLN